MNTISARGAPSLGQYEQSREGLDFGLAQLMDELAYGVLIIDLTGRLLHANHAARQELARGHFLCLGGDTLRTCRLAQAKILQESLVKVAAGKRSMVTFAGTSDATLTLAVLPLQGRTRAALVFARASVCESLTLCFFARSHGLTHTEEHVLGILCQGYSAPQIAAEMKVAVSTIRSHVRSLCAKTYSSGVRQLVNRVATLPPVAPALRLEQMH